MQGLVRKEIHVFIFKEILRDKDSQNPTFYFKTKLDYSYFVPASHHDVINMNLGENQN